MNPVLSHPLDSVYGDTSRRHWTVSRSVVRSTRIPRRCGSNKCRSSLAPAGPTVVHKRNRGTAMTHAPEQPIRVLLVDDHAVVRKGMRALLDREPAVEVVGEAGDGEEAVRAVDRLRPEVI